jgi:hypothetical protein
MFVIERQQSHSRTGFNRRAAFKLGYALDRLVIIIEPTGKWPAIVRLKVYSPTLCYSRYGSIEGLSVPKIRPYENISII